MGMFPVRLFPMADAVETNLRSPAATSKEWLGGQYLSKFMSLPGFDDVLELIIIGLSDGNA